MPDGDGDDQHDVMGDDWVSIAEASRRLGVTRAAVYGRIERRTLATRPKGNRGVEVLLPAGFRHGDDHHDVVANGHGDRHPDVTLTLRLEELLERAARAEGEAVGLRDEVDRWRGKAEEAERHAARA